MKSNAQKIATFIMVWGACLYGAVSPITARSQEADQDTAVMSTAEAEKRAAAARAKDAAWKPSSAQTGLIQIGDSKKPGALKNFCLDAEGNLLTCYAPQGKDTANAPGIRVYSPKGQLLKTLPVEIKPVAICRAKDGSIFVAGDGRVLKLDPAGKVVASADSPVAKEIVNISKETEEMVKEMAQQNRRPLQEELARMKTSLEKRRSDVTGLAVTDQDLFMVVPAPSDFTFRVYRFSLALQEPKLVVEKLRGCCGQMDIQSHDGKMWIPHNARHTVESRDRDGNQLTKFGKSGKVKATDFGGCCEPKNLRVLANGDILAAESGPPTCIKRFSADGKFIEVVALVDGSNGDCVRVAVEASPDGSQFYLMDTTRDAIRVFAAKK